MMLLGLLLAAYLLGGIPSAYIAGKSLRGIDIRQHGSGNMGATNVFRVLGPKPGTLVLLADMAKGALAAWLLPRLSPLPLSAWAACLFGLIAVLGHSYTPFLGFKGGKGVATSAGVFLGLAPLATLGALGLFATVFAVTRMVSAGSLLAALALPLLIAAWDEGGGKGSPVLVLSALLALVIWLRHITNIKRILAGTESRFAVDKKGGKP